MKKKLMSVLLVAAMDKEDLIADISNALDAI